QKRASRKMTANKIVKLTLPENVYEKVAAQAEAAGMGVATWIKVILCQSLQNGEQMAREREVAKRVAKAAKYGTGLTRIPDLF
ncbi:hypothetical protein IJI99_02965, partial [bacterium]|nr:hypothetical protein [bacterium]